MHTQNAKAEEVSETEEFERLRREIRKKANNFGQKDFRREENGPEVIPISKDWGQFDEGPVRAKWVPTDTHNCTLVLFDVPARTVIDFHDHRPTESFVVVGDVTVYTPGRGDKHLRTGDVMKIQHGEPHAAEFHQDTLLTMLWTPAFPSDPDAPEERVLYRAGGLEIERAAGS